MTSGHACLCFTSLTTSLTVYTVSRLCTAEYLLHVHNRLQYAVEVVVDRSPCADCAVCVSLAAAAVPNDDDDGECTLNHCVARTWTEDCVAAPTASDYSH